MTTPWQLTERFVSEYIVSSIVLLQNALLRFHFIAKQFFDSVERPFIVAPTCPCRTGEQ
jgi:hypothetical protein